MKKLSLSYRTIKWLTLALLLVSLLPLLALGRYAVPAADDFSYGAPAHLAYEESGSVLAALSAAAGKTAESYMSWQGTFSAIFLMAVQPAVFSHGLYALTPLIMLAAYIIGSFMFCRAFFGELLGLNRDLGDIAAALLCAVSVQLMPSPVQGLYWFNGAVYYMLFHGVFLGACGLAVRLVLRGGRGRGFWLCLVSAFLGGGNYVTALVAAVLFVFSMGFLAFIKDGRWKRLVLPALLLLAAFAVSIVAPGNSVRQAAQENTPSAVAAVLLSFKSGLEYGLEWLSLPVLGLLLLLAVLLWQEVKGASFAFRFPGLVSLFSYCLFSAMFCPPIYAMGNVGDKRLLNIVYFSYLLLLALNLCYWLGWAAKRSKAAGAKSSALPFVPVAGAFVLMGGLCLAAMLGGTGFASVGALSTMSSGEARAYHDCALRRLEVLEDDSVRDARLECFPCQPYLLWFDDVTEDPEDWRNEDMASYYSKDSVVLD